MQGQGKQVDFIAGKGTLLQLLLIAFACFLVYANTFHVPFVFDDESSITRNPVIKHLENFLSGPQGYQYNPRRFVAYLTLALNYRLGGLDVVGYHLFNLAVHLAAAWLVYYLVRLTLRTPFMTGCARPEPDPEGNAPGRLNHLPLLTALLFAVHPVQTQAVTYIVQRMASLSTMFYLLSLVLYGRARLCTTPEVSVRKRTGWLLSSACYLGALLSAGLAMKTKETAFTLPLVIALYEGFFFRMQLKKRILSLLPVLLTLLIVPVSLLGSAKSLGQLISDVSQTTRVQTDISRLDYLLTQFRVLVTYLRLIIFPANQNLDYDYPVYHTLLSAPVLASLLLLLLVAVTALFLFRRSGDAFAGKETLRPEFRLISFGIFWFFITSSVESSLIPIADVIFEHRLYLPSFGIFLALATGAMLLAGRWPAGKAATAAAIVLLALGICTWERNDDWRSSASIWSDVTRKSPGKARGHNNLGNALLLDGRLDQAIAQFEAAVRIDPGFVEAHNDLGSAYDDKGWTDKAIEQYRLALTLDPQMVQSYNNLADALLKKGWIASAIELYEAALKIKPDVPEIRYNLGSSYLRVGRVDDAIGHLLSVTFSNPDLAEAHFVLGEAYAAKGWQAKAASEMQTARALGFNPDARNDIGGCYGVRGR